MTNTASVIRMRTLSTQPPKNPVKAPIETPMMSSTSMAVKPMMSRDLPTIYGANHDITPDGIRAKGVFKRGRLQAVTCIIKVGIGFTKDEHPTKAIQEDQDDHDRAKNGHLMPAKTPPGQLPKRERRRFQLI